MKERKDAARSKQRVIYSYFQLNSDSHKRRKKKERKKEKRKRERKKGGMNECDITKFFSSLRL
jgi:hypothetical protein